MVKNALINVGVIFCMSLAVFILGMMVIMGVVTTVEWIL
jgi:hypothetical protein